ncbi:MAG: T9SS type A sorting domain-containing protein [Bacteroidota bacterium]
MKQLLVVLFAFLSYGLNHSFSQYVAERSWGIYGTGDGQFNSCYDIAVDNANNIYVSDRENHRIQKFTSNGNFLTKWGNFGTNNGEFNRPHGIYFSPELHVEVCDFENHRLQSFNATGGYISKFATNGPSDVAVDINGNFYVLDFFQNKVKKYDGSASLILSWGSAGSGDGQFNGPMSIALDVSNNVYVVDQNNHRVQKFNSNGTFITKWGAFGSNDGQFNTPYGIAIDGDGNVFVTDYINNRIQKFNSTGQFITKFGTPGSQLGQFNGPTGVGCDNLGNVYVADYNNYRVQKFIFSGNNSIATQSILSPMCAGQLVTVPFVVGRNFEPGNIFTAQLSDPNGDFTNPVSIGTLPGISSGSISATIPNNAYAGTAYRIRVVASYPYLIGTDNGHDLVINALPQPVFTNPGDTTACRGVTGKVYTISGSYTNYVWTFGGTNGVDYIVEGGGGSSNNSATLTWLTVGHWYVNVSVTNSSGCTNGNSLVINVGDKPSPQFISAPVTACQGQASYDYSTSTFTVYNWTITGQNGVDYFLSRGSLSSASFSVVWLTSGIKTITLTVINEFGCVGNNSCAVNVQPQPSANLTASTNQWCLGNVLVVNADINFTNYIWSFSGTKDIDYRLSAGGLYTNSSATLTWLTVGSKTITLTAINQYGCRADAFLTQQVYPAPNPVFLTSPTNICRNSSGHNYSVGSFSSYSWVIAGTAGVDYIIESGGGTFNDNLIITWLTPGAKTVEVTVTNQSGCPAKATTNVTVLDKYKPSIQGNADACQNTTEVYRTPARAGAVFKWSVLGGLIQGFDDRDSVIIRWTQAGNATLKIVQGAGQSCSDSTIQSVIIKPMPAVTLDPLYDVCADGAAFELKGGLPEGGTYAGTGVYSGYFNPKTAGVGIHEITYSFQNINGCIGSAKQNLRVNPLPPKPVVQVVNTLLMSSATKGNQWFLNGAKIIGEVAQFYVPKETGRYNVQVTDENGCVSEMSDSIRFVYNKVIDGFTGSKIKVYPNPVTDKLYIDFSSESAEQYNILITNLLSESVYNSSWNAGAENIYGIDTKAFANGCYILILNSGNKIYSFRLIIQH